ncbi:MAG: hypothetical protein OXC31_05770 [Spirochaetaceae bacterium]|nr:hypothetical protein [Spirochaetaceae bacterium]
MEQLGDRPCVVVLLAEFQQVVVDARAVLVLDANDGVVKAVLAAVACGAVSATVGRWRRPAGRTTRGSRRR